MLVDERLDFWIKEQEERYAAELFKLNEIKLDLEMQTLVVSETKEQIERYKGARKEFLQ